MNQLYCYLIFASTLILPLCIFGQTEQAPIPDSKKITRSDSEWIHYYNRILLSKKVFISTDGGVRRNSFLKYWDEYLVRTGVNYKVHLKANVGVGAAYINSFVTRRPEFRIYQEINTNHNEFSKLTITTRLRLEERLIANEAEIGTVFSDNTFSYRTRFRLNILYPILKSGLTDDTFFLLAEDEFFVNMGRNIAINIFDRNRMSFGLGYRYSKNFTTVLNYTYQFSQNNIGDFTHTDIAWLSLFHTFDFLKTKSVVPRNAEEQ